MDEQENRPPRSPLDEFLRRLGIGLAVVAVVLALGFAAFLILVPRSLHHGRLWSNRHMMMTIAEAVHMYEVEHGCPPVSLLAVTSRHGGVWSASSRDLSWWLEGVETHIRGTEERPWRARATGVIDRWGWPYLYSAGDEVGRCVMVAGRGPDGEWAVDDPLTVYSVPGASPGADDILAQKRDGGWVILQGDYCKELAYLSSDR